MAPILPIPADDPFATFGIVLLFALIITALVLLVCTARRSAQDARQAIQDQGRFQRLVREQLHDEVREWQGIKEAKKKLKREEKMAEHGRLRKEEERQQRRVQREEEWARRAKAMRVVEQTAGVERTQGLPTSSVRQDSSEGGQPKIVATAPSAASSRTGSGSIGQWPAAPRDLDAARQTGQSHGDGEASTTHPSTSESGAAGATDNDEARQTPEVPEGWATIDGIVQPEVE